MGTRGCKDFKKRMSTYRDKCHLEVKPLESTSVLKKKTLITSLHLQCYCKSFLNPLIHMYLCWEIKKCFGKSYSPVDFQNRRLHCYWVFVFSGFFFFFFAFLGVRDHLVANNNSILFKLGYARKGMFLR